MEHKDKIITAVLAIVLFVIGLFPYGRFGKIGLEYRPAGICAPGRVPLGFMDRKGNVLRMTYLQDNGQIYTFTWDLTRNEPSTQYRWTARLLCPDYRVVVFIVAESKSVIDFPVWDAREDKDSYREVDILPFIYLPEHWSDRLWNVHADLMIVR